MGYVKYPEPRTVAERVEDLEHEMLEMRREILHLPSVMEDIAEIKKDIKLWYVKTPLIDKIPETKIEYRYKSSCFDKCLAIFSLILSIIALTLNFS